MLGKLAHHRPADLDGYQELLIAILKQAVVDARAGSEEALDWLLSESPDLAQQLDQPSRAQGMCPDCGQPFAQGRGARAIFCPGCAQKRQRQRLQAKSRRAKARGKG